MTADLRERFFKCRTKSVLMQIKQVTSGKSLSGHFENTLRDTIENGWPFFRRGFLRRVKLLAHALEGFLPFLQPGIEQAIVVIEDGGDPLG